MKTITFYSYKGGVGRSLTLSNMAIRLSEFKKNVCILDFDLDAPGLQFKFTNYAYEGMSKGIVDYISEFSINGRIPHSISEYCTVLQPSDVSSAPITLIPSGNIENNDYWKKLSKIDWREMFYSDSGSGIKFFLDFKRKVELELKPDFFLIDSRTGITDISGITLKILADEVVILAANNKENLFGTKKILSSLFNENSKLTNETPTVSVVLTRIPFKDSPKEKEVEFNLFQKFKTDLEANFPKKDFDILVIHSDQRLEINEEFLIGDNYEPNTVSISNDYLKLFDKITKDVLTTAEVNVFRDRKIAAKEFEKARSVKDFSARLQHINKAISLDETRYEYYWRRAAILIDLGDHDKGHEDLMTALKLNPNAFGVLSTLAWFWKTKKNDNHKAKKYIDEAIEKAPQFIMSHRFKANLLKEEKKYLKALEIYNHIISELDPNDAVTLNSRADLNRVLGNYKEAYQDVVKAIEIDSSKPVFFGTLAEIHACRGEINEFYVNLVVALSRGITTRDLNSAKEVYEKFAHEDRFLNLLKKFDVDLNELVFLSEGLQ